jgi:hypothetical protein
VDVALLAMLAGVVFGALSVAVRVALRRARDPEAGAFVCALLVFLDEPLRAALVLATVAIVLGGALLVWEPSRLPDFRPMGLVLALVAAGLFAVRDNVVGERDRRRTAQRDPVALGSALRGGLHRSSGGGRAAPGSPPPPSWWRAGCSSASPAERGSQLARGLRRAKSSAISSNVAQRTPSWELMCSMIRSCMRRTWGRPLTSGWIVMVKTA